MKNVWLGGEKYALTEEQFAAMSATAKDVLQKDQENAALDYLESEGIEPIAEGEDPTVIAEPTQRRPRTTGKKSKSKNSTDEK